MNCNHFHDPGLCVYGGGGGGGWGVVACVLMAVEGLVFVINPLKTSCIRQIGTHSEKS